MRLFGYFLILLSVCLFADAAYDQRRGIATACALRSFTLEVARREDDPIGFRNLMADQWFRAVVSLGTGLVMLRLCRRLDRLDPLSQKFAGKSALDELDRTLSEEQERRRRPQR